MADRETESPDRTFIALGMRMARSSHIGIALVSNVERSYGGFS